MRFLWGSKDGGPDSKVRMWGIESKAVGSLVLLKFDKGGREAYHTHAFHAVSWVLSGWLYELLSNGFSNQYKASSKPIITKRDCFHKVRGVTDATWVLSFRGPWVSTWLENNEHGLQVLTHGRVVVK